MATRDAWKMLACADSSNNQKTYLDEVGNQYKGSVYNPRVEVSESFLYLHGHWFDKALLFL
jgi:hypothetical protein